MQNTLWNIVDFENNTEQRFIEFPFDPMAGICAYVRLGRPVYEFVYNRDTGLVIEDEDRELAKKIRNHFRYKLFRVRILNNRPLSSYETKLERLLEDNNRVELESQGILATLYQFYCEDQMSEEMFSAHCSLGDRYTYGDTISIDDTYKYVGRIQRISQKTKSTRYYFQNSNNELLLKEIVNSDCGKNLMDYILDLEPVLTIKGHATVGRQPGHDFRLLILHHFELARS